jgi:four helix bundle protein
MKLEELKVYELAMEIGNQCWIIVTGWNYFEKDTTGRQLVKAADSIAANISEGYGRFHSNQRRYFNFIARGSLFETKTWLDKAYNRGQISIENHELLKVEMNKLCLMLNSYIKNSGNSMKVEEPPIEYHSSNLKSENQFIITEADLVTLDEIPYPDTLR